MPLIVAQQPNKPTTVRPAMNYSKLNEWIVSKPGWLRLACSFVKRMAEGVGWDVRITPEADAVAREMVSRVMNNDPVKGCEGE